MKLFISENDNFTVTVFAYEDNGAIEATTDKSQINKNDIKDYKTIKFTFKHASYASSRAITEKSQSIDENGIMRWDAVAFQNNMVMELLAGWDIKDEQGNEVPFTPSNLSDISPSLIRAAVGGALLKIKI